LKLTFCLLFAAAAHADTVTLTLNPNLSSPTYTYYTYTDYAGDSVGEWVAPYQITLSDPTGPYNGAAYAICFDINNATYVGQADTGHLVYDYTDTDVLEATYLANLLNTDGDQSAPVAVQGAIALAIWQIMFPTSTNSENEPFGPSQWDPAAQPYIALAAAAVAAGNWTSWDTSNYPMWVPDNPAFQRFGVILQDSPPVVNPEPGGWLLFGTGLAFLAWLRSYRARHAQK
jgi:hypothetical protein